MFLMSYFMFLVLIVSMVPGCCPRAIDGLDPDAIALDEEIIKSTFDEDLNEFVTIEDEEIASEITGLR